MINTVKMYIPSVQRGPSLVCPNTADQRQINRRSAEIPAIKTVYVIDPQISLCGTADHSRSVT